MVTFNNINESQKQTEYEIIEETKLIYSKREQISGGLEPVVKVIKIHRDLLGHMVVSFLVF